MNDYAILKDGVFYKFVRRDEQPEVATHKGYAVLPVVRETVDNSTQPYTTRETVETIEPTRYLIQQITSDRPQAEIDVLIEDEKDAVLGELATDRSVSKALGLALFDLTNEVQVLKSQQPLTLQQFKTYVRGKL
jgi:hypothetical protein